MLDFNKMNIKLPKLNLTIENKGSTARDHLANERTFLSWLRTSVTLSTIGLTITQLTKLDILKTSPYIFWIGIFYSLMGCSFLGLGLIRYFRVQNLLLKQFFPSPRISIFLGTLILFIFCIVLTSFLGIEKLFEAYI